VAFLALVSPLKGKLPIAMGERGPIREDKTRNPQGTPAGGGVNYLQKPQLSAPALMYTGREYFVQV